MERCLPACGNLQANSRQNASLTALKLKSQDASFQMLLTFSFLYLMDACAAVRL